MRRIHSCGQFCLFASICAVLFASGCGKKDDIPETVPVSGKVTVDGQPVTSGQVSFTAFDKSQKVGGMCTGKIDSSGGYVIYTGDKEGAPPGRYKVSVTPTMAPTGDTKDFKDAKAMMKAMMPFDPKFGDADKSKIIINVTKDAPPGTYDLKLTK
jgi:hypothetical protein